MKALNLIGLVLVLQFMGLNSHAFSGHDQFKVEMVKPWGEFGFRAVGRGHTITEMRFDCSKTTEMGLVVSVVNLYGKTSSLVLPAEKLGADKFKCHENLKKYFAGIYTRRTLASQKDKNLSKTVELNFGNGGFLSSQSNKKTLSFL